MQVNCFLLLVGKQVGQAAGSLRATAVKYTPNS